jgi:hypothetical protein
MLGLFSLLAMARWVPLAALSEGQVQRERKWLALLLIGLVVAVAASGLWYGLHV